MLNETPNTKQLIVNLDRQSVIEGKSVKANGDLNKDDLALIISCLVKFIHENKQFDASIDFLMTLARASTILFNQDKPENKIIDFDKVIKSFMN